MAYGFVSSLAGTIDSPSNKATSERSMPELRSWNPKGFPSMSRFFSDFIYSLANREEIPADRFDAVWQALRRLLRRELRRRGMADQPPSYLGVYGYETWFSVNGSSNTLADRRTDALEELVADSFTYIFCHRLRSLSAQLRVKESIEGLIHLNVRHFIHDRQRVHDPIGLRTYEMARSAVENLVNAEQLRIIDAGSKLRSGTLLAFFEIESETPLSNDLGARVRSWNDHLMPDLLTVRGAARKALISDLQAKILGLREDGIRSFRFGELLDPLRYDVRARWAALYQGDAEGIATAEPDDSFHTMTRHVVPPNDFEEREHFDRLVTCVERRLERSAQRPESRRHLLTLWRFLRVEALGDTVEIHQSMDHDKVSAPRSTRQLAEQLRIPRGRLPSLLATLGRYLERCRRIDTVDSPGLTDPDATPSELGESHD